MDCWLEMALRIDYPIAVYLAREEGCEDSDNGALRHRIYGKPPVILHSQVGSPRRIKVIPVCSVVKIPPRDVLPGSQRLFIINTISDGCMGLRTNGLRAHPMPAM
jgi:hypothetical protein